VCIIDQGRVIAMDTPKALIGRLTREREIHLKFGTESAAAAAEGAVRTEPNATRVERADGQLRIRSGKPEATLYHLLGFASEYGWSIEQISIRELSLEDVFIAFTGKEWRD